jgi:hypothetical protein
MLDFAYHSIPSPLSILERRYMASRYEILPSLTRILAAAYYFPVQNSLPLLCVKKNASSDGNDYSTTYRESYHSLLARDDLLRRSGDISRSADRSGQISQTN